MHADSTKCSSRIRTPRPTLSIIIPELKRRGFEILTLTQLFERRGVDPNSQQDLIWNSVPASN